MRNFFFPAMESERVFDPATPYVFLGGTINGSNWRQRLIEKLKVNYFDPVVSDWNPDHRRTEEMAKSAAALLVYAITPKQTGFYTIAEMTHAVFGDLRRVAILILDEDDGVLYEEHQQASISAIKELLHQRIDLNLFDNVDELAHHLNKQLEPPEPNHGD